MADNCGNCHFSRDVGSGVLLCRRYPPSIGPNYDHYPEVNTGKWCGEHIEEEKE